MLHASHWPLVLARGSHQMDASVGCMGVTSATWALSSAYAWCRVSNLQEAAPTVVRGVRCVAIPAGQVVQSQSSDVRWWRALGSSSSVCCCCCSWGLEPWTSYAGAHFVRGATQDDCCNQYQTCPHSISQTMSGSGFKRMIRCGVEPRACWTASQRCNDGSLPHAGSTLIRVAPAERLSY